MPVAVPAGRPTVCVRRAAFEEAGLTRGALDHRFNLTPDEFTVEAALVVIGPLANEDLLPQLIEELESAGLTYFDDFFELSGNWPEWLRLYAMAADR
jgi:8-oxo-dGTP pyrophosphatase MutT (NUDIX family)